MESLRDLFVGGGPVMWPLLALSVAAVAVIIERLIAFAQYGSLPQELLARVLSLSRDGHFDEAAGACRAARGPLAACLLAVIDNRDLPVEKIERLVEETGQDYFIRLERLLPVLDTTTTIAPLLGLLGTITGMIRAFKIIGAHQQQSSADGVLGGVGEALYATATGLIIAVICFAAYNYFTARLRRVTAETEQGVTKLINVLATERGPRLALPEKQTDAV